MPSAAAPPATDLLVRAFGQQLDRLGPFEPAPRLAVAVSGGADSTAVCLLAAAWARARGGSILGLIVDHGLRPAAAAEAAITRQRLADRAIPARILALTLGPGPAIAARARAARYAALTNACREAGIVHLLLGHHAGDQAETHLLRRRAASGPDGLAAMAALADRHHVRLLRPLLTTAPAALRDFLQAQAMPWLEDPTNYDRRTTRARLRAELATAGATAPLLAAAATAAQERDRRAMQRAHILATRVHFSPLGYAVLSPGPIAPDALGAIIRMIGGRFYPSRAASLAALAAAPCPATLAGVRILPAGRLGPGWLLVREHPAPPIAAATGAIWNDFRLISAPPPGCAIAAGPRGGRPHAIARVLPALWRNGQTIAGAEAFQFVPPAAATETDRFAPAIRHAHSSLSGDA